MLPPLLLEDREREREKDIEESLYTPALDFRSNERVIMGTATGIPWRERDQIRRYGSGSDQRQVSAASAPLKTRLWISFVFALVRRCGGGQCCKSCFSLVVSAFFNATSHLFQGSHQLSILLQLSEKMRERSTYSSNIYNVTRVSTKIWSSTIVFNFNKRKCSNRKSVYYTDFWRSCDTEDWSNDAENAALTTGINHIFQYMLIHNSYIKL